MLGVISGHVCEELVRLPGQLHREPGVAPPVDAGEGDATAASMPICPIMSWACARLQEGFSGPPVQLMFRLFSADTKAGGRIW